MWRSCSFYKFLSTKKPCHRQTWRTFIRHGELNAIHYVRRHPRPTSVAGARDNCCPQASALKLPLIYSIKDLQCIGKVWRSGPDHHCVRDAIPLAGQWITCIFFYRMRRNMGESVGSHKAKLHPVEARNKMKEKECLCSGMVFWCPGVLVSWLTRTKRHPKKQKYGFG